MELAGSRCQPTEPLSTDTQLDFRVAEAFDPGRDPDDQDRYDAAMSLFASDIGVDVDKAWCATGGIIAVDLPDLKPFWAGEPVTGDIAYGPALFAPPETVKRIGAVLSGLTNAEAETNHLGLSKVR